MSDRRPGPGGLEIWFERLVSASFLAGQVFLHLLQGRIHRRNTLEQMSIVGPESTSISLVTAGFVGMVFTIQ
ncbi:MAG: ABC transporter permease, partial [Microcystaceae cyanobacterium]